LDRVDLAVPIELVANEVQEDDGPWAEGRRDHWEGQLVHLEYRRSWCAARRSVGQDRAHDALLEVRARAIAHGAPAESRLEDHRGQSRRRCLAVRSADQ